MKYIDKIIHINCTPEFLKDKKCMAALEKMCELAYKGKFRTKTKMKKDMDFKQFKKEWADTMVYKPPAFDYEVTMHELYIEYKESLSGYGKNMSVKEWCEFFHADCDLDQHPYMLKEKALQTKHSNSLRELANRFRKGVGLSPISLIKQ